MKTRLKWYLALALITGLSTAGRADDAAPPPGAGMDRIRNSKINVDVLDFSWKSGMTWELYNKTECIWEATVKNNNPEARHICINFEFLDGEDLAVFQNGKCDVVAGNSEGIFTSSIMVSNRLVKEVVKTNVVALEAHRLHSFVPVPAAQ